MSRLAQVLAARGGATGSPSEAVQEAENIEGRKVLTASAPVAPLGWRVFGTSRKPSSSTSTPVLNGFKPLCYAHPNHWGSGHAEEWAR
jgi:hypothetical protein